MSKQFYTTTAIYYVNSAPHIGSSFEAILADVVARYRRLKGERVHFLTGTDENATKVYEAAVSARRDAKEYVDEVAGVFRTVFDKLHIAYDDFIRTTEPRHIAAVQEAFRRLQSSGHIYKGDYEGWYDVRSETFFKESELVDGKSPDGNEVRWVKETNYFFKLSAFQNQILEHIDKHPSFIQPENRRNEVIAFVKQGLRDACISRATTGWGIPVPGDDSQVIYVWFDALINYISAIGWPDGNWQELWPAEMQLVGKDILVRFHATLWPAILMGLGLELPRVLLGHAWILMGQEKISKSTGHVVAPLELAQTLVDRGACDFDLAVDAVRYYSMRIAPYENDSTFTFDDFDLKFNSELVNDISNGIHRVVSMTHNFCGGIVPDADVDATVEAETQADVARYVAAMDAYRVDEASAIIGAVASRLNLTIDREKPWELRKNSDPKLASVMRTLCYLARTLEGLLSPIAPKISGRIASLLDLPEITELRLVGKAESLPTGHRLAEPKPMMMRLEKKQESTKVEIIEPAQQEEFITIEDFMKIKLRVARVLDAHKVENADKLLRLELMVGDERRQVLAGIAQQYTPEDVIGRQVVIVANLKPRKLRGFESQGMILAADAEDGGAILLMPDKQAPEGTSVH
ncbi:MAG: methionine--tRNA ligase [Fimbriimonadales bacterium]